MRVAALTELGLVDRGGAVIAAMHRENPLAEDAARAAAALPAGAVVVAWSGSLGAGLFERTPATWMPGGRAALSAFLDSAGAELDRRGGRLLLRPHARHVVSDAVAARAVLAEREGGRFGLAFDPASCFEASMLEDADDHLVRMFEIAGPLAEVVILRSVGVPRGDAGFESPALEGAALGEGALDSALLGRLVREHARGDAVVAAEGAGAFDRLASLGLC